MRETTRILIVEDHTLVAEGMVRVLEQFFTISGVVHSGSDALRFVRADARLDIVLLDLSMPGMDGLAVLHQVPPPRAIVVTAFEDPITVDLARHAGAWGYHEKFKPMAELVRTIRLVADGHKAFPETKEDGWLHSRLDSHVSISPRRAKVLLALAQGLTQQQIASQLGISIRTVEEHLAVLRRRLEVSTNAELTAACARHGMLSPLGRVGSIQGGSPARE